jgi:hypothetical protein
MRGLTTRERHLRLDVFETRQEVLGFAFYKRPQFLFIFTYSGHVESYHRKGRRKEGGVPNSGTGRGEGGTRGEWWWGGEDFVGVR